MLAKLMLPGNAMKLGERATARPLIWPTLEKAFVLIVLLNCLFHRQSIAALLGELFGPWLQETIAGVYARLRLSFAALAIDHPAIRLKRNVTLPMATTSWLL